MEANKNTLFWECPSCCNRISQTKIYELIMSTNSSTLIIPSFCPIFLTQDGGQRKP